MLRSGRELWVALGACVLIGALYMAFTLHMREIPPASELFGHGVGIIGFTMMLMTESLYSLRKRTRIARWGRMADWLQFHIFTGIVGPFMVLLHSSWKFNGLAGVVMMLTIVIVLSGFVGRYIFTRIPRSVDGLELTGGAVSEAQRAALAHARRLMALWHTIHIPIGMALFAAAIAHILGALYYATLLH
ncbi:MAG: hypothetical protein ACK2T0_06510 [Anaerolineales bacterium]